MASPPDSNDSTGVIDKLNIPLDTGEGDQTEVGNYFVANYPPFSFWSTDQKDAIHDVLNSPRPEDTNLGVYFHIPFCRKRCHFCYFRVYTDKNANEINAYLDAGIKEFERYSRTSYLAGRKPQFVYFGGGTPSYLSVSQLQDLTDRMKDLFPWDETEEVAFECEPGTLTEKKLEALREIGVTRLSLGIENFDDHILEVNGRAHRSKEAFRSLGFAKTLGFDQVNIDLIAGMMDETPENWQRCVETAIEQEPDCVTIYQMEIPYNTTIYKEMQESGRVTAPVANWQTKRAWVDWAFDQFEAAGYTVSSAYTVVKNPETTKFVYRDSLWEGADLLSAGVASFGHFGGVHYQNQADVGPYMTEVDSGDLPIYRAYPTTEEERFIREFVLQLKLGSVHPSYFEKKYGVDPLTRFPEELKELSDQGYFSVEGDTISVSREDCSRSTDSSTDSFSPNIEMHVIPDSQEAGQAYAEALHRLLPFHFFYEKAGKELPDFTFLEENEVPYPYRSLLVHRNDMTPTLAAFHHSKLYLSVHEQESNPDFVMRLVSLHSAASEAPVEYGAIGIQLAGLSSEVQKEVVAGKKPLGGILGEYEVEHTGNPSAYFSVPIDDQIANALRQEVGEILYGRCNQLIDRDGMVFADIVEILPRSNESEVWVKT